MKKYLLSVLCLLAALYAFSQTNVVPFSPNDAIGDGVVYYLPKTVIVVETETEQTVQKVGPFVKYAQLYLGVKDVVVEDKSVWQLTAVKLRSMAQPDENRAFKIMIAPNTVTPFVKLNHKGIICAVNTELPVTNKTAAKKSIVKENLLDTAFHMNLLSQETLVANSIPKMAELAAKQIYRIRENRANLLSGENTLLPDGTALKIMLNKLEQDERELTALFVGKTFTRSTKRQFEYEPQDTESNHILFRISHRTGIVALDDLTGSPVYLNIEAFTKTVTEDVNKKGSDNGLFYAVPGKAHVEITDGVTVFAEKDFIVPQFGGVTALPATMFNKSNVQVIFDSLTGQILSIQK